MYVYVFVAHKYLQYQYFFSRDKDLLLAQLKIYPLILLFKLLIQFQLSSNLLFAFKYLEA